MDFFKEYTQKIKNDLGPSKMSKLARLVSLAQAVIYIILVLVVVYGMKHLVYAGFPVWVPWLIMLIFAVMAYRRVKTFLRLKKDQEVGRDKLYDEMFAIDEDDDSYYKNYFK